MGMASLSASPIASGGFTLAPWIVLGTAGNDTIMTGGLMEIIYAGDGADLVRAGGGNDEVYGEGGNDTLYGENGNDTVSGGAGNDSLDGGAGNDALDGGIGDDFLDGGAGQDQLSGGDGNDTFVGRSGSSMNGGAGNDIFYRGSGGTVIDGGTGIDEIRMSAYGGAALPYYYRADVDLESYTANIVDDGPSAYVYATNVVFNVENIVGIDQLVPTIGDVLRGDAADNQILGLRGDDLLDGRGGNDHLDGGADSDDLFGREGEDTLIGGDGIDWLQGGADRDYLVGGGQRDFFVFDDGDCAYSTGWFGVVLADAISDFQPGQDSIDLRPMDANSLLPGDQSFTLVSRYTGTPGEIIIRSDDIPLQGTVYLDRPGAYVFGDTNGDRMSDWAIHIENTAMLGVTDFML